MALRRTLTCRQRDLLFAEAQFELLLESRFEPSGRGQLLADARQLEDFVALYDDIGWEEHDDRLSYTLTMPDAQLVRIAGRLRDAARELLVDGSGSLRLASTAANPGRATSSVEDLLDANLELLQTARGILGEAV